MRPRRTIIRIAALVTFSLAAQAMPASAQGFFGWFGQRQDDRYPRQNSWSGSQQRENSWFGQQQERRYTPQANAYSDPTPTMQERHGPASTPSISGSTGRTVAYCVRLCDGRYFPMQQRSNATSIQLCNAFCPAAKTQVFNGTEIDRAIASNGARYANLDNAFVYRQKIVAGCTCNGKDEFGLAKIDVKSDPTLKPGDIVATGDNQKAALVAAANRQARNIVTENAALRRGKSTKASSPDTEERPED